MPKVFRTLEQMGADLVDEVAEDLRQIILNKDRTKFIKRLRAISPAWVDEKKRRGWKLHQLAATGEYARAIDTFHDFSKHTHRVSVKSGQYPGRKFSYADLARYLEFGTKWFLPIPHWRKAAEYFRAELQRRVGKELKNVSVRIG